MLHRIVLVERLVDLEHNVDVLFWALDHKPPLTSGVPDFPTFLTGNQSDVESFEMFVERMRNGRRRINS